MLCPQSGHVCQITGCTELRKMCAWGTVNLDIGTMTGTCQTTMHPSDRIKQLEEEVSKLKAENMNLRSKLGGDSKY